MTTGLAQRLLDALPQTQCTRCGYPDCAGYAQAIADGAAAINQCPPGGVEGVHRLAAICGLPALPLNPANGVEGPLTVAVIDEAWCIGCTLCIKVCPTDAILGSNKQMHTVIEADCTGCDLCVPVCPVDCIQMENVSGQRTGWAAWSAQQAGNARQRYAFHQGKVVREVAIAAERREEKAEMKLADLPAHSLHTDPEVLDKKRQIIEAALARSRKRKAAQNPPG